VSCSGDGFSVDVDLDIIGIAVEVESMLVDDITKGEHEQEWTKHRTLDTLGQRSSGECAFVDVDELFSVCIVLP